MPKMHGETEAAFQERRRMQDEVKRVMEIYESSIRIPIPLPVLCACDAHPQPHLHDRFETIRMLRRFGVDPAKYVTEEAS